MRLSLLSLGVSLAAIAAPAAAQTGVPSPQVAPGAQAQDAPAPTTNLREALVQAYNGNPELAGERATLRATDENVPIARASGLPGINGTASYSHTLMDTSASITSPTKSVRANVDLSLPVYSGGAVKNSVRGAERRVEAGRALLRGTEADVFTQATTAYVDVIRDEAIVRLNQQNVHALDVNLQATRDRFEVGDLTRTDVAQSEARYALAQAQLRSAEARLIGSRESYIRVVGTPPGVLAPPPPLPNLPADVNTAMDIALENNANLEAAEKNRDASAYDVRVAQAGRLPRLSVGIGSSYYNYLDSVPNQLFQNNTGRAATAGVQLQMPLYQGGRPAAEVRQARARQQVAMEQLTLTERGVVANARSAFASYQAALRVIESSRVAVEANRLSLEGVRAENSVGTRTILDILNAEQELLNSQVTYVTAERDAYVAGFTLLSVMGRAEAEDLGLDGGPLYDPVINYRRAKRSWLDSNEGEAPVPQGTRTVDTPIQTPEVSGSVDPLLQRPVDTSRSNP